VAAELAALLATLAAAEAPAMVDRFRAPTSRLLSSRVGLAARLRLPRAMPSVLPTAAFDLPPETLPQAREPLRSRKDIVATSEPLINLFPLMLVAETTEWLLLALPPALVGVYLARFWLTLRRRWAVEALGAQRGLSEGSAKTLCAAAAATRTRRSSRTAPRSCSKS
jgi:hypothetical protein